MRTLEKTNVCIFASLLFSYEGWHRLRRRRRVSKNVQIRILRHRRSPSAMICDPKQAEIKKKKYCHHLRHGEKKNKKQKDKKKQLQALGCENRWTVRNFVQVSSESAGALKVLSIRAITQISGQDNPSVSMYRCHGIYSTLNQKLCYGGACTL